MGVLVWTVAVAVAVDEVGVAEVAARTDEDLESAGVGRGGGTGMSSGDDCEATAADDAGTGSDGVEESDGDEAVITKQSLLVFFK